FLDSAHHQQRHPHKRDLSSDGRSIQFVTRSRNRARVLRRMEAIRMSPHRLIGDHPVISEERERQVGLKEKAAEFARKGSALRMAVVCRVWPDASRLIE